MNKFLLPGQSIITKTGMKLVENIEIGDAVLSVDGEFRDVLDVESKQYSGPIRKVALTRSGPEVSLLPDVDVIVHESLTGDRLRVPVSKLEFGQRDKETGYDSWRMAAVLPKLGDNQELQYIDVVGELPDRFKASSDGHIYRPPHKKGVGTIHWRGIPANLLLDEELAFMLGLYVAEGSVSGSKEDPDVLLGHYIYTLSSHYPGLKDRIIKFFDDRFGLKMSVYDRTNSRGSFDIYKSCIPMAYLLSSLCGKGFLNKRVPPQVWDSPLSVRLAFVDGLLTGDGKDPTRSKNPHGDRNLRMSGPSAVWGVRQLLVDVGEFAKVGVEYLSTETTYRHPSYHFVYRPNKVSPFGSTDRYVYRGISSVEADRYSGWVHSFTCGDDTTLVSDFTLGL